MKNKTLNIILRIIGILILIPLISWLLLCFQPKRPLNIYILDKTVPTLERNEHRSFNWILTHNRYVKENKRRYSYKKDYFGFFPLNLKKKTYKSESIQLEDIFNIINKYDMLYYTDTYGVYYEDWLRGMKKGSSRSTLIYGGLNSNDYSLMLEMNKIKKLIITEYNILAPPTSVLIKYKIEELFDIHWSGWVGRYFDKLDPGNPDLPEWVVQTYKNSHYGKWPFKESGIIFMKNNRRAVILENGTHLNTEVPMIFTDKYGQEKFDIPGEIHYPFEFDITLSGGRNRIVSTYEINVNEEGDSLLQIYNIPKSFPAVIEGNENSSFYYFAGDFADYPVSLFSAHFKGIRHLDFLFYNEEINDRSKFYWKFYMPMISKILDDYYNIKK